MVGLHPALCSAVRIVEIMTASERIIWPIPPAEWIAEELKLADERTFQERVERNIYWLTLTEPPPTGWSLPGGPLSASAWWEAGRSFIGGNFLGAILLTQTSVEHSLSMALHRRGAPTRRATFKQLIDLGLETGELDAALATKLHRLRLIRNPYVHADVSRIEGYVERAQAETGGDPYALSDTDARQAIEIGADFIRHLSGNWDELVLRAELEKQNQA